MSKVIFLKKENHPIISDTSIIYFTIELDSKEKYQWFDCVIDSELANPQNYLESNIQKYLDDINFKISLYNSLESKVKGLVSKESFVKPKLLAPTTLLEKVVLLEERIKILEEKLK